MAATPKSAVKVRPEKSLDFLWQEARTIFLTNMTVPQAKKEALRDDTTLDETFRSLKQAQEKATKAFGPKFVGSKVEFKLGQVLQRLEFLLHIGDEAMKFAPESASYVWAAFRILATGIFKDFDACRFVVDSIDQVSEVIFVCDIYARRQLQRIPIFTQQTQLLADRILKKIPPLLALVLKFAYETRKLVLDHGRIGRSPF
jgi:hypothetical protein